MNTYALLLRNETIDFGSYSPNEIQQIISEFDAWNAEMIRDERLIVSASLQDDEGKTVRTGAISDGPYSEAKEAVAGLLIIQAEDYAQATKMATQCPFVPRGGSVEVRLIPKLDFEDAAQPIIDAHKDARSRKGA